MSNKDLERELTRKIAKDLGATPFSIGKVSMTHNDLLVKPSLRISDEKGLVKNVPLWYGEAYGLHGLMCCLLTALNPDPDNLEVACVIGFKNTRGEVQKGATRAGFKYDWADDADQGLMLVNVKDQWLPLTMVQRLQLALGLENMVQEGVLWNAQPKVPEEFKKNLSEIIEVDI